LAGWTVCSSQTVATGIQSYVAIKTGIPNDRSGSIFAGLLQLKKMTTFGKTTFPYLVLVRPEHVIRVLASSFSCWLVLGSFVSAIRASFQKKVHPLDLAPISIDSRKSR